MMFNTMTHSFQRLLISCLCMAAPAICLADDSATQGYSFDSSAWQGEWQAENTTFILRVIPEGNRFAVEPIQPLGLDWTSSNGIINGNSGTINVEYQGVTALVLVQLITHSSAIVRSMSCQPDYHVVCTLVRNQQALFIKQ
ncbi:MAG: hypothetical protein Q7W55_04040 [Pseudohongiella sp.]|nr:hypothetical protein [Pseudohongiella sp.]MDO9521993.1 hypothetical protein [Pseudohongiella sp.]MDP2128628.1 hypothetical protein [Pseudohongiella sp.]